MKISILQSQHIEKEEETMIYGDLYRIVQSDEEREILKGYIHSLKPIQQLLVYVWSSDQELQNLVLKEIQIHCQDSFKEWEWIHSFTDLSDSPIQLKKLIMYYMGTYSMSDTFHKFNSIYSDKGGVEEALKKIENDSAKEILIRTHKLHLLAQERVMEYAKTFMDFRNLSGEVDPNWLYGKVFQFVSIDTFHKILSDFQIFSQEQREAIIDLVLPSVCTFSHWESVHLYTNREDIKAKSFLGMIKTAKGFDQWKTIFEIDPSMKNGERLGKQKPHTEYELQFLIKNNLIKDSENILKERVVFAKDFDSTMSLLYSMPEKEELKTLKLNVLYQALNFVSSIEDCNALLEEKIAQENDELRLKIKKLLVKITINRSLELDP